MIKLFVKSPSNGGWTLIEIGAVAAIVGILAALAIPSMVRFSGKQETESAKQYVLGNLREAQRAAIKNSAKCTVSITSTQVTATPTGCITDPFTVNTGISLSPSASSFSFTYKGNPDLTTELIIVITSTKTSERKCIVVATGIGIMRAGNYDGTNCITSF